MPVLAFDEGIKVAGQVSGPRNSPDDKEEKLIKLAS
jgi:hypothetical protein